MNVQALQNLKLADDVLTCIGVNGVNLATDRSLQHDLGLIAAHNDLALQRALSDYKMVAENDGRSLSK